MIPAREPKHHLILYMDKQASEYLKVSVGSHANIMTGLVAIVTVEVTVETIVATYTYFPWIKNTVTNLRRE